MKQKKDYFHSRRSQATFVKNYFQLKTNFRVCTQHVVKYVVNAQKNNNYIGSYADIVTDSQNVHMCCTFRWFSIVKKHCISMYY